MIDVHRNSRSFCKYSLIIDETPAGIPRELVSAILPNKVCSQSLSVYKVQGDFLLFAPTEIYRNQPVMQRDMVFGLFVRRRASELSINHDT